MDEHEPHAQIVTDHGEQVAAIKHLIDLIESGQVVAGALRVYLKDGAIQDIAFGDSEEDQDEMLAKLRAAIQRALH